LFETYRRQYIWIKSLKKKLCIFWFFLHMKMNSLKTGSTNWKHLVPIQHIRGPTQNFREFARNNMNTYFNPLNAELNPICYLLALLGAHHFLHVSRIRVKSSTLRLLMSYIYRAPTLDVSRSHTTTQHSR